MQDFFFLFFFLVVKFVISRREILFRGLRVQCPNCGGQPMFENWFRLHRRCPHCAMELSRGDGFFLGAMVWNYGLIVFGCLPCFVLLYVLGLIGGTVLGVLSVAAGLFLPVALYPWAWSLWFMTYYLALPNELPANEVAAIEEEAE